MITSFRPNTLGMYSIFGKVYKFIQGILIYLFNPPELQLDFPYIYIQDIDLNNATYVPVLDGAMGLIYFPYFWILLYGLYVAIKRDTHESKCEVINNMEIKGENLEEPETSEALEIHKVSKKQNLSNIIKDSTFRFMLTSLIISIGLSGYHSFHGIYSRYAMDYLFILLLSSFMGLPYIYIKFRNSNRVDTVLNIILFLNLVITFFLNISYYKSMYTSLPSLVIEIKRAFQFYLGT